MGAGGIQPGLVHKGKIHNVEHTLLRTVDDHPSQPHVRGPLALCQMARGARTPEMFRARRWFSSEDRRSSPATRKSSGTGGRLASMWFTSSERP